MKKVTRVLILVMVSLSLALISPSAQPVQAGSPWIKGLYAGWVYYLARADFQMQQSMEGASLQYEGARFYESHGDIHCSVFDEDGNGNCTTSFPMDIVWGAEGTFTSPSCSLAIHQNGRADAVNEQNLLTPLTANPLEEGFSVDFTPKIGPERISTTITGCQSMSKAVQFPAGQPQWPQLDFHVEYHTALSIGGTCSMEGLPRSTSVGPMTASLSLEQCQWRALFLDPYAVLP